MKKILLIAAAFIGLAHAQTKVPPQLINGAGSTAGQAIVSTGPTTSPGWATVTAGGLTPIGANTVYGNFTGSSASPLANAVPSCSTANSALKYTTSTGLSCGTAFALTSGNLSQFAATTSAQLLGVLSDETGTGNAVFSVSPTFTGTVNTASLTASGAITPSQTAGIVGTNTNNSANAGSVGEYPTSLVPGGSAVALTSTVTADITSISLTAGDWDVWGVVGTVPAGGTSGTGATGCITLTSATCGALSATNAIAIAPYATSAGVGLLFPVGAVRVLVSAPTTVYLAIQSNFSGGTNAGFGRIDARRRR